MKQVKASKNVSLRNFAKLSAKDKEEIVKQLTEKAESEIQKFKDPVEKNVERKKSVNVMMRIEVALKPVVKEEGGLDLTKINFGAK